jgi:hypothetical protein
LYSGGKIVIRAIPGSQKYTATAAAHHGYAFGSLVLVDLRIPGDLGMIQDRLFDRRRRHQNR